MTTQTVQADDDQNNKSYSIQAVLPDNQLNKNVSYYDLQVKPNQPSKLGVVISNTGSEKITVQAEINNAYTTDAAMIGYDKYSAKIYKSETPSLSSLIDGKRKKSVTLDAGQSKQIDFTVNSPKNEFRGIILGGVTTTAMVSSSTNKKVGVSNQIRYVKGVVLHSKDEVVDPEMHLQSAAPKAFNDVVGIGYLMDNTAPININDVKIKATISHKSMKNIEYSQKDLQIAPNSKFDYFIPVKHLKPGIYSTKLTVTSKAGYSKTFNNKLKVTQGSIEALDETKQVTTSHSGLIYTIIGLFVVLIVGLWFFMYTTGKRIGFRKK